MHLKNISLFILIMAIVWLSTPIFANKLMIEQFISPETCGGCHSEIYDQWHNSMHNLAHKDPVYLEISRFFISELTDNEEIAEAESCVKCHTPVGYITGYPKKSSDDRNKVPEIATHGIQCDYCHSATGADKMYNNGLILRPGNGEDNPGVKRGPRKDAQSDFHETEFSKFHTDSNICGTCHNVKHVSFGINLETTFDEWEKGPYNSKDPAKRITCQGCHMYQRVGVPATGSTECPENKGASVDDGPIRDHIFTHNFVGGNSFIPESFDRADKSKTNINDKSKTNINDKSNIDDKSKIDNKIKIDDKAKMAEERLKNAATLSIDDSKIKDGELSIIITNSGAGHDLPTGLTDIRQMWLEITVLDEKGDQIFSSGKLDKNGYLPDNAIIFNTIYGDEKGKPVQNIAKARVILKTKRIPPLESVTEKIKFTQKDFKYININVKLLYRSASKKLLDKVAGKDKFVLPVITMAEIDKKIKP
ncbi:MAG: cytochrome c554 family protein [Desulfamplus sp.]|nr:cytochrome c554 family protein [Desulfamplus sp.]